jgi:hypothetical protein
MPKEVPALGWAVELENVGDGVPETVACPLARLSQQRLEFGEGLFDGIEIRAVGRQVEQPGLAVFDRFPDASDLVGSHVVHNDDIARAQRRGEHLLDVGAEGGAVHGAIQHVRRGNARGAQARHESGGLPMTMWNRGQQAQTAGTPAKPSGHVGCRRGFINEDKTLRIECRLAADESPTGLGHIRTLLLGGVQAFF